MFLQFEINGLYFYIYIKKKSFEYDDLELKYHLNSCVASYFCGNHTNAFVLIMSLLSHLINCIYAK